MHLSKHIICLRKRTTSQLPTWATDWFDSVCHPRGFKLFFQICFDMGDKYPGNLFTEGISNTYTLVGKFPGNSWMESTSSTFPGVSVQDFFEKIRCSWHRWTNSQGFVSPMSRKSNCLKNTWTGAPENAFEVASMKNFPGKSLTDVYVCVMPSVNKFPVLFFTHVKKQVWNKQFESPVGDWLSQISQSPMWVTVWWSSSLGI